MNNVSSYKRILVVGRPNVGKTSIINCLAGCNLKVGNFAGVTTDLAEVMLKYKSVIFSFIDTPGIYSLNNAMSRDEKTTVNAIKNVGSYDIILNVIDGTKPEIDLLLTREILQAIPGKKLVLCFNSVEAAQNSGIEIALDEISSKSRIPAVKISSCNLLKHCDDGLLDMLADLNPADNTKTFPNLLVNITKKTKSPIKSGKFFNGTRVLDYIFLHKILGLPCFIFIMLGMFKAAFSLSDVIKDWMGVVAGCLFNAVEIVVKHQEISNIINNGIFQGVFSLLQFLPSIMILFFCINLLEKSGYMARVSFLMDSFMRVFRLSGKAVIPLVTGFGCSIPAYLSVRILPSKIQRISAMFAIGFMTCSAKFTFFMLLVGSLFSAKVAPYVLLGIYIISAVTGLLISLLINVVAGGKPNKIKHIPYLMEMPKYRFPNLKQVFYAVQHEVVMFVKKAGTFIIIFSSALWFLSNYPVKNSYYEKYSLAESAQNSHLMQELKKERLENSIIGRIGEVISPIFAPLGFDWRMNISVISGLIGKEIAVVSLGVLYNSNLDVEDESSWKKSDFNIRKYASMPACLSFITFFMYYIPCISAATTFAKEAEYKNATIYLIATTTIIAWIAAFLVYRLAVFCGM